MKNFKRMLLIIGMIAFSIMFAISVVGPLLSELAEEDKIPLGSHPNTSIGIIFALGSLAMALFQIPFARLADRYGRRKFILFGSAFVGIFILMLAYSKKISIYLGLEGEAVKGGWSASTYMLAISRSLEGVAAAATWPVLMSVIASSAPKEAMGIAMGIYGAAFGLGMSLGPALGPFLASAFGIHVPFVISFLLACMATISALALPESRGITIRKEKKSTTLDFKLISLSAVAFSLLYGMGSIVVIYPRYMIDFLRLNMKDVGIAMSLAGLTTTFLQPLTGKLADIIDKRLMVTVGLPLAGAAVLLAGYFNNIAYIYASMLLFGIAGALVFPASNALLGIIAPKGREGAYTGVYNAMLSLGVTVSPIIVGIVADVFSYFYAFSTSLIVAIASVILFIAVFSH